MSDQEQVKRFNEMWNLQGRGLTAEKQDAIGRAYLKHIIGADDKTIDGFLRYNAEATDFIGFRQGGAESRKNDQASYWAEVAKVTPDAYSAKDIEWLTKNALEDGAFELIFSLSPEFPLTRSEVVKRIRVNAHAYR